MSSNSIARFATWVAVAAAAGLYGLAPPGWAQQAAGGTQPVQRCGGLFCDMYYARNPPAPAGVSPGAPASGPAPGRVEPLFLPCHDFVCAMFGGRDPESIAVAAVEPAPAEPEMKPKKKPIAKRAAKHTAERTAKNDAKPSTAAEPARQ